MARSASRRRHGRVWRAPKSEAEPVIDVKTLHAKIGELALGPVFCPVRSARRVWRRAQENDRSKIKTERQPPGRRAGDQPEQRHCQPRPFSDANLKLRRRTDKLHMECPFVGARMLRDLLAQEGVKAGRLYVAKMMKRMGVEVPILQQKHLEAIPKPQY
jgi:hypothetical protein